jgi:hypothetical protein
MIHGEVTGGRKRAFEVKTEAVYAKYGVTEGEMICQTEARPSCGVICGGWPSWALGAKFRGWDVSVIVIKNSSWAKRVKCWFPEAVVLESLVGINALPFCAKIEFWFSDYDPPRPLAVWESNASYVVTVRRARHVTNTEWRMEPLTISHLSVGGVTDGAWNLHVYHRGTSQDKTIINQIAPRDLGGVLDTLLEGRPCPPPIPMTGGRPSVKQIRPNTYHGQGALPWDARNSFVIAPCLFSPTGWVRRRFSQAEMTKVLDVSEELHKGLTTGEICKLIQDTSFVPLKVICALLDSLPHVDSLPAPKKLKRLEFPLTSTLSCLTPNTGIGTVTDNVTIAEPDRIERNTKAAKNDDAAIPEYLWNEAILPESNERSLNALSHIRSFALRWWKRHTTRDFLLWRRHKYHRRSQDAKDYRKDTLAGLDCVRRCANSSWWEWTSGSRPLFWRWPEEYQTSIRDGVPPWVKGPLPEYTVPQRGERDPLTRDAIIVKLKTVREKGYLIPGNVRSLTSFFAVPKGEGDVRLVYDGTKSGLNGQLWAPWFLLPTVNSHLRCVQPGSYMGDIDFSEQFLNFMLHEKIRAHAGVDLTLFFPEECTVSLRVIWEHWCRCGMGFVSSPYNAIQGTLMAEERIRGNHLDPLNVFRWDKVILNLPGSEDYVPSEPWVFKIRFNPGQKPTIANDLVIYVDDARTIACSYEECRLASRTVASLATHLGLQDAARKRRDPSQTPGPWAGSIVSTFQATVVVSVSVERWKKAKDMILWIQTSIQESNMIDHKVLESYRGFLVYISRTYPAITPYLKGIHLTLDSWRPWRSEDSWKMTMSEIRTALKERDIDDPALITGGKPPSKVKISPRLFNDVEALHKLFLPDLPPQRPIRPDKHTEAVYMFGDASGSGFGSSFCIDNRLLYQHGQWSQSNSEESSNYRELSNLINAIKDALGKGLLDKRELFVFTDNFTAESAFFKGSSSSRKLFELVLDLRNMEMHSGLMVHMIHVAGLRMISQGTDGLSRGISTEGVMTGKSLLSFVPLHLSALERQGPSLQDWVLGWFSGSLPPLILEPNDWFLRGHSYSTCVWSPPPAAADVAIEQLAYSIHKRPQHTHVVLVPRLMTARWRKLLGKVCNLIFTVPIGSDVWALSQFEPLIVGLYLPLSRHKPWNLRNTPLLERVERLLREMPATHPRWGRIVLRELLQQARALESMSAGMVRKLLHTS